MILRRLLPDAMAWRMMVDRPLRRLIDGLESVASSATKFVDTAWQNLWPSTTGDLIKWEAQFGLPPVLGLTAAQRRDRLDAAWSATGGQAKKYIEDTLRANGFDVYVHNAWVPGTRPPVNFPISPTFRSPLTWLRNSSSAPGSGVDCGEPDALCGEPDALCGERTDPPGYPLINKVFPGEGLPEKEYTLPASATTWPFYVYIGASTFGDLAEVPAARKDEFETLCLRICPAQHWLGMFVEYS